MATITEQNKRSLRQYREKKFDTKVGFINTQWLYLDEINIDITHNGHQWQGMTLTPEEAEVVVEKLTKFLNDNCAYKKKLVVGKG